jgi:general secretion pathway protein J
VKQVQRGFTLLEIMLVLSLLGVLLTLVGGALLGANRAVLKAQRYTVSLDEMRAAQHFLRTAIGQALPLDSTEDDSQGSGFFEGSAQRLEFVATLPGTLGGGIQRHTLSLVGEEGKRSLQVAFAQVQSSAEGTVSRPWGEPQVLVRDVAALQFSYRGVSPKGVATGWVSDWPWPTRLPRAVRIDAQVNGPVPWLSEVVALRLDLSGGAGGQ